VESSAWTGVHRGNPDTGSGYATAGPARSKPCGGPEHGFESEREGEAVNTTTPDPGTPIFGELNKELGELPEIEVHDFDSHGFEFPGAAEGSAEAAAEREGTDQGDESTSSAESGPTRMKSGGGRRRKED
jgi:hypothetical protein